MIIRKTLSAFCGPCILAVVLGACSTNEKTAADYAEYLSNEVLAAENSREQEELERILHQIFEDAKSKNVDALAASHLVTPKFSKFGPRVPQRQDVESTNQEEAAFVSSFDKFDVEITDPKVDVFGNVAIVTYYLKSVLTHGADVKQGSRRGTLVFARTRDGWKIVHEHTSPQ
jgi:ketosteroid isomerase-like protein